MDDSVRAAITTHADGLFDKLFEESAVGLQINSPAGRYLRVNRAFAHFVGYDVDELIGRSWRDISFDEEVMRSDAIRARLWSRDEAAYRQIKRYLTKDGRTVWGALTVVPFFESDAHADPRFIVATVVDVTSEMDATEALSRAKRELLASEQRSLALIASLARAECAAPYQADVDDLIEGGREPTVLPLIDPLTGVSTHAAVHDRLQHALDCLGRTSHLGVAVAVIDSDDLATSAVEFGEEFVDDALCTLAQEVTALLRPHDSVGRLGEHQFLAVMEGLGSHDAAHAMVDRLTDALSPVVIRRNGASRVELSIRTGVAWSATRAAARDLLAEADRALLESRRDVLPSAVPATGDGYEHSSTREAHLGSHRIGLRELSTAIDEREFVLHYQPICDAERRVVAVEALLRWQHPRRGLLTPHHFLNALMHSGHFGSIGAWVLATAAEDLARWDELGVDQLQMHVNVSPAELAHPNFPNTLRAVLDRHPLDPERLVVEVTETSLDGSLVSTATLRDIVDSGTRLVLDDFGTGVSSLAHLRTESLHGIKIDRSFVSRTSADDLDRRIVQGVVGLAHQLGIEVTAEGVETEEQASWITSTGCHQMQGWLFSTAVASASVPQLVRTGVSAGSVSGADDLA